MSLETPRIVSPMGDCIEVDRDHTVSSISSPAPHSRGSSWRIGLGAPTNVQARSLPSRVGMFRKKKPSWPEPELSVGRLFPSNYSSSGHCWEAVGPVREAFDKIAEEIKGLFESQSDYLDEGEEVASTFSYGIWMIGPDEARATPTIVLACKSSAVRTKAKEILKQSGLLQPLPGIAVKKSPKAPEPFATGDKEGNDGSGDKILDVYSYNGEWDRCGVQIVVTGPGALPAESSRKATMGGLLLIDDVTYGLTVSHVFDSAFEAPATPSNISFAFDEDSDSDAMSLAEHTSKGSLSPPSKPSASSRSSSSDDEAGEVSSALEGFGLEPGHSPMATSSSLGMRQTLELIGNLYDRSDDLGPDWALVEPVSKPWRHQNRIRVSSDSGASSEGSSYYTAVKGIDHDIKDRDIWLASRFVAVEGYLSSTPTYIRPAGLTTFVKAFPLNSDKPLEAGDSGVWVVDRKSRGFCGHVFAGHYASRIGYVVAARDIVQDIEKHLGWSVYCSDIKNSLEDTDVVVGGPPYRTVPQKKKPSSSLLTLDIFAVYLPEDISDFCIVATVEGVEDFLEASDFVHVESGGTADETTSSSNTYVAKTYLPIDSKLYFHTVIEPATVILSVHYFAQNRSFIARTEIQETAKSFAHQRLELIGNDPKWPVEIELILSRSKQTEEEKSWTHEFSVSLESFQTLKLLGEGEPATRPKFISDQFAAPDNVSQMFLVRKKDTGRFYAMKVIPNPFLNSASSYGANKKSYPQIISIESPFVLSVKFSFEIAGHCYLVVPYTDSRELFRCLDTKRLPDGRLPEEITRFYIAEILCALRAYHDMGAVIVSLKPDNILLDKNGHVVVWAFGQFDDLDTEGLMGDRDFRKLVEYYSLGKILFEMTCGRDKMHLLDMPKSTYFDPFDFDIRERLRFQVTDSKMSREGCDLMLELLSLGHKIRLWGSIAINDPRVHPWFAGVDWKKTSSRLIQPPIQPIQSI